MKAVKYLLFFFNLVFVVFGVVLITLGVSVKTGYSKYVPVLESNDISLPSNLFLIVGSVMFFIAFLGCCGAVRENHCMMMTYSVLVGLLLILELAAAVAAFYLQSDMESILGKGFDNTLDNYYNQTYPTAADHKELVSMWNVTQSSLHCCGANNYTDWTRPAHRPADQPLIPEACCLNGAFASCTALINEKNLYDTAFVKEHIYLDGCVKKVVEDISINKLGVTGIVLAVVELLGVICACFMARSIRYSYETV